MDFVTFWIPLISFVISLISIVITVIGRLNDSVAVRGEIVEDPHATVALSGHRYADDWVAIRNDGKYPARRVVSRIIDTSGKETYRFEVPYLAPHDRRELQEHPAPGESETWEISWSSPLRALHKIFPTSWSRPALSPTRGETPHEQTCSAPKPTRTDGR